jgi:hypothetical protein
MHIHIVNLCIHVPIISFSLYKIAYTYLLPRIIVPL